MNEFENPNSCYEDEELDRENDFHKKESIKILIESWENHKNLSLKDVFSSDDFNRNFSYSAEKLKNSGHESGFDLYLKDNGELFFTDVSGGDTTSWSNDTTENFIKMYGDINSINRNVALELMSVHFHPEDEDIIVPSVGNINSHGDLYSLIAGRNLIKEQIPEIELYPVSIIGQRHNDNIRLLVLQEDRNSSKTINLNNLEAIIRHKDQKTILSKLRENGFKAYIVDYDNINNEILKKIKFG
jgi:hypothetical protein